MKNYDISQAELHAFAREGAKAEIERIFAAFPDLATVVVTKQVMRDQERYESKRAARRKLHWTQTAAGKKKMSRIQRKAWRARKAGT